MTGTTNCEPQLDGIQKRFSFMYQTGVKSHVIVLDHNLGKNSLFVIHHFFRYIEFLCTFGPLSLRKSSMWPRPKKCGDPWFGPPAQILALNVSKWTPNGYLK